LCFLRASQLSVCGSGYHALLSGKYGVGDVGGFARECFLFLALPKIVAITDGKEGRKHRSRQGSDSLMVSGAINRRTMGTVVVQAIS
jgi:hypothetical protein